MLFLIILQNLLNFLTVLSTENSRSFVIDYQNDRFLKDTQPYRLISGSMHYFRVPDYYWEDRLLKMKAAGLNAVETYVAWNLHQPNSESEFIFAANLNLFRFLYLAQKHQLDVVLRMGPYICAEFEFGGIPWWLLKKYSPDIKLRTSDPRFLLSVEKWYSKLLPVMLPYLHKNGGPVIAMQIENEYGSRPLCDLQYTLFLKSLFQRHLGEDLLLFTTDGPTVDYLRCGYVPGVYPTIDFGAVPNPEEVENYFLAQRAYAPRGPLVNSEFYTGWLDLWGNEHSVVNTRAVINTMTWMHNMNASYNFYMFHGGSNFGYTNGASKSNQPSVQSYDYDAPLSEAGDLTEKYFLIKRRLEMLTGVKPSVPVPPNTEKFAYGTVVFERLAPLTMLLDILSPLNERYNSIYPLSFERLGIGHGYVLYETNLNIDRPQTYANLNIDRMQSTANLNVQRFSDRAYVMIDGRFVDVIEQVDNRILVIDNLPTTGNIKLQILVENMGRQNMGPVDSKGILDDVYLDSRILTNWTHFPLRLERVFDYIQDAQWRRQLTKSALENGQICSGKFSPSIFYSFFKIAKIGDTFFNPINWSKGQFFLNNINVGRYWPSMGPQVTVFVPKPFLKTENVAVLFELENPGNCERSLHNFCNASFIHFPIIDNPIKWPNVFANNNDQF